MTESEADAVATQACLPEDVNIAAPDATAAEADGGDGDGSEVDAAAAQEARDEALDEDAKLLLADLEESQAEVERMLAEHRLAAGELGGMREGLQSELSDLQDEKWKLELFGELESLKRQLMQLKGLEADMDAAEAILDTAPELLSGGGGGGEASTSAGGGDDGHRDGDGDGEDNGEDDGEDYDPEEIARMQAELDKDLADMFTQLQAVKAEAADISAHKAMLEAELRSLLSADGAPALTAPDDGSALDGDETIAAHRGD